MLTLDIPAGTTIESLVTEVVPALHARFVGDDAPRDLFVVAVRVEHRGTWTARIRGREMTVKEEEDPRPTFWMHATELTVEHFLEDALGPRRLVPRVVPAGAVVTMSDPRVLKRLAMASGRIGLVARGDDGERLAVTFGFGDAARRGIDPDDVDVELETTLATLQRVVAGALPPEAALTSGDVTIRGNRLLALQLALAVAPFYPAKK